LPVQFSRLRIAGFKSFAEPATVEILPGLTGIVGPNGCGKSNVVEALRWAMGEQNARILRGNEMEDVIFAGTAGRPSRNIAEVALTLDDTEGVAPPPFDTQPELEIIRRIERGSGSAFRVNGKEVRARDVQTLFADLASGARASAMVSQGRVGALVGARPEERRSLLEEAAGITGLHARRHEAELKLRAAEANLARAEDAKGQLEAQLAGLKRQARQASRYRNISGAIRQAEAELLALQRARAEAERAAAAAALEGARGAVQAAAEAAQAAEAEAREKAEALPALRETEAEARTALERHRLAQEQLVDEERRAREALAEGERRLAQLGRDLAHAADLCRDAESAEQRLTSEDEHLAEAAEGHPERLAAAENETTAAAEAVAEAERASNRATEAAAEANARLTAAEQQLSAATARAQRLNQQHASVSQERDCVRVQAVDPVRLTAAEAELKTAEGAQETARTGAQEAEQARGRAQAILAEARARQNAADSARAKLAAEARALTEVLAVKDGERWPPMVDSLEVPAGLEAALGAALGEELTSAADPGAARHWRELPALEPVPPLPEGAESLLALVRGPAALGRALSQLGLVAEEAGEALQPLLAPGQTLVSRQGAVWRWDGYTIHAGTPTAAAVRLQQRNRLTGLRRELAAAEAASAEAAAARHEAEAAERAALANEQQTRSARSEAERWLERARAAAAQLRSQAEAAAARLAAVEEQLARIEPDRTEAETVLAQARDARTAIPDVNVLRATVETARAGLAEARRREGVARSARDTMVREQEARVARRTAVAAERAGWRERAGDAKGRLVDLTARRTQAEGQHAGLIAAPAEVARRREEAMSALQAAEAEHRRAATALGEASKFASEADQAARGAEAARALAREDSVRAEAAAAQADHAWGTVAERILERLGVDPVLPEVSSEAGPEAEEKARKRHERLVKERDEMGPVNLRADIEAEETEKQIEAIDRERDDITTAIAKLRGSIGHLNREGRDRLTAIFTEIDRHFQALFSHMFGGGRAHLALVGSEDPLEAGLEIYAQPPGKKLATLSLLSGGEQALTALSLIFAVFRCNPAPVCVLDEVDAPLDDVNVDRFCTLLEDMVRETATRFLVVTHHPLTMSRMDRLYGVTMQERGVSRLLSVDLSTAEKMVEPERLAAD
jgi:chromosome segregation protein